MAPIQIIICLALTFNAVIGFESSGKHFVISCPWLRLATICTAYLSTSEKLAKVATNEININRISQTRDIYVERKFPVAYLLGKENYNYAQPIAKYPVRIFRSDKLFQITVITLMTTATFPKSDALLVLPKTGCYNSYYTITAKARPFFTIFSFDYPETEVKVKFPKIKPTEKYFNLNCFASKNCAPDKTITTRMSVYEAWYFTIDDEESSLMNVLITSNNRVYVVSGNCLGWSMVNDMAWDYTTTSIKSSKTWGKTYVVPSIFSGPTTFGISSIEIPLTYQVHEGDSTKTLTFGSTHDVLEYDTITNTLVFTSDIPFGLYHISSSETTGVSILNLIPVEQWMPDALFVHYDLPDTFKITHYLITQAPRENVIFPPSVNKENDLTWHTSQIMVKGKKYSVAEINVEILNGRFFVGNRTGRMMLYVVLKPSSFIQYFIATYPHGFYQGSIYQKNCNFNETFCIHDGIDNDCDGYIDEETENGVDDDGDGLVDEDNTEPYSDGYWSSWSKACDQFCNGMKLSVRVRSCLDRSPNGQECEGDSIQCDEIECPKTCVMENTNSTDCFCRAGCSSCERSIFECASCQAEYMNTEHCLTRRPAGLTEDECPWETEIGSMGGPEDSGKSRNKIGVMVVGITGCFAAIAVLALSVYTIQNKRDSNKPTDDPPMKPTHSNKIQTPEMYEGMQCLRDVPMPPVQNQGTLHRVQSTYV